MRRKLFFGLGILLLAVITMNVSISLFGGNYSRSLMLANVEALATGEEPVICTNGATPGYPSYTEDFWWDESKQKWCAKCEYTFDCTKIPIACGVCGDERSDKRCLPNESYEILYDWLWDFECYNGLWES